jgi:hypothetical protein
MIDRRYLIRWEEGVQWSTLIFPKENPPRKDFLLWRETLFLIGPRSRLTNSIGHFTCEGHKIWPWRMDVGVNRLYHLKENSMDVYSLSTDPTLGRRPNIWTMTEADVERRETGDLCLVKESVRFVNVLCHVQPSLPRRAPAEFWDVIREWGETWMWDLLHISGNTSWLEAVIAENTCMAVTDGSYMKEVHPLLNSAAFVFECTRGRGRIIGSFVEKRRMPGATVVSSLD